MQAVVESYSFIFIPFQIALFGKGVDIPNYDNCYYLIQLLLNTWNTYSDELQAVLLDLNSLVANHLLELLDFILPSLLDYHVAL